VTAAGGSGSGSGRGRAPRRRREASEAEEGEGGEGEEAGGSDSDSENSPDVEFQGGFKVPGRIHRKLFDFQRTGVKWLWELHCQRCGGIIGDEMGLGKTIQVAAFLAGLHYSGLYTPSLIVCPATMLRQWERELTTWYPQFNVHILHDSGMAGEVAPGGGAEARKNARARVVNRAAHAPCGVLITTYEHLRLYTSGLCGVRWGYAVLDEGHKIRNPDAEVTIAAKQLQVSFPFSTSQPML
jgi:DNA excision repair protein ERCC-6